MKKFYFIFEEGSKINQIICALLINMPMFAYGATMGWMSPMSLLLQSKNSPRQPPLTDYEISWMAAVPYLTAVPATFMMAYMADKIGRKMTLLLISLLSLGCWIAKLSSMEVWAFILGQALLGLTMGGCYVLCPLYIKEISEDSIRGFLGSWVVLFHTSGNLFLHIIGDIISYRTILWVGISMPTLHLVLFMMMPESPSYLVMKGKMEEAARVISWLRCKREDDAAVLKEVNVINNEQDAESNGFALKAILKDRILLRAFAIAIVVALAREVCGAIPVLNFAADIFEFASEGTDLVLSPNQQAMMLGAVQVAGSFLASGIVEKAGRKPMLFTTSLVSGLSMGTLATWFLARNSGISPPAWLPIVTLCICIFCDSAGLCPISVVVIGEIFSYKYRSTVFAIVMAAASFSAFIQMLSFKPLANAVGVHVAFYFFGVICIAASIYVLFLVPETKQRSLHEIYEDLKTKKERQKFPKVVEMRSSAA